MFGAVFFAKQDPRLILFADEHRDAGTKRDVKRPPDAKDDQFNDDRGDSIGHTAGKDSTHTRGLVLIRVVFDEQSYDQSHV